MTQPSENSWPAGLRRTKPREMVWQTLRKADHPLSVPEIYARIESGTPDAAMAVSTIYRILAVFEEQNVVTRTTIMGEDTAIFSLRRTAHEHYAICLGCHKQVPVKCCPFDTAPFETGGFTVTSHRLELYGYCSECKRKNRTARKTSGTKPDGKPSKT